MTSVHFGDVDKAVKAWLMVSTVAPLVTRTSDSGISIYLAMPPAAPKPSVVFRRVGGGPRPSKDFPEERIRYSFDCWGLTRDDSGLVARTLVEELESLARDGVALPLYGVTLYAAEVIAMRWLPDPDSDSPRFIVDALITTVTA